MAVFIDKLTKVASAISGGILVAMVGFIFFEILLRSAFSASTYVLDEFVGYGVAIMTFLSFSSALRSGTFIRVNLLIGNVNMKLRRGLEVLFCAGGACLFSYLCYYLGRVVIRNFERGTTSNSIAEVPLWIPQSLMLLGVALLVLQFISLTIQYMRGAPILDSAEEL
ncbi:MAG: TRAP transporter small permease [Sneathiella sp.]|nr:TRAP transporter small permease [Sneathiella sp.]